MLLTSLLLNLPVVGGGLMMVISLKKNWFAFLKIPIDGGLKFQGKPIFGKNKTWLGPLTMTLSSTVIGSILWRLSIDLQHLIKFQNFFEAFFGFGTIGLAYSLGELPNSFAKRRMSISPGKLPVSKYRNVAQIVDLIDGVLTVALVYMFLFSVPLKIVIMAIMWGVAIHLTVHQAMIKLRLKSE